MSAFITNLTSKIGLLITKTVYYSKVSAEVAKQVYIKEGLAPPTTTEFQSVFRKLYKEAIELTSKPKEALVLLKNVTGKDLIKYSAYGIQLAGLYNLGEIIGRRKIVGYNHYDHE
ncbi:related to ATP synthase subunit g, mitochondrial [Saccharomycodes ludwigii]|uniref:Related to ATP synthase subunit g, mitochondrial n=1 Tax=Saccharomycodes ludwigii TaxID=36035 RepID=A0A376B8Z7_9ASCO|nr:hypothetical protein SCDLUD_001567 [Saccharomycodes ludwigii]KAH3901788.1 hypothetical protein SCDLUD_001567 [Saccharomycodes ludwigii]SSD61146.1 related to ATP synthase subunit g, mitochondrial [Saccharomycodes ludwigii]